MEESSNYEVLKEYYEEAMHLLEKFGIQFCGSLLVGTANTILASTDEESEKLVWFCENVANVFELLLQMYSKFDYEAISSLKSVALNLYDLKHGGR